MLWIILRAILSGSIAFIFVWLFNRKSEAMRQLVDRLVRPYGIEEMCRDSWNWQWKNPNGYTE